MSDADRLDCLCFGEALVDFFPPRAGLQLAEVDRFDRHVGGAPTNVAIGLARQGLRVGVQTLVGPDAFGDFVRAALEREGIDVSALGRHPTCKTGVAFVSVSGDGARSFLFFRHPSADMAIGPEHVTEAQLARTRLLHLGSSTLSREPSRSATLRAVALARAHGVPISIDPNLRAHLWDDLDDARGILRPILATAAVVKISDDELEPLLGIAVGDDPLVVAERAAARLRELGCGVALVTLGERGAWFDAPAGRGHVPAPSVTPVDTTGAGDAFVAGFWAALVDPLRAGLLPASLPRAQLEAAIAAGCRLGADAVLAMGATAGIARAPRGPLPAPPTEPHPWVEVGRRELLVTRILRVEGRALLSPRTGATREFTIVDCRDWCNVVALTDDGDVVMVRQVRHGTGEVTLELPGGMIDPDDASPVHAAIRELREETGYVGRDARLIGTIAPNPAMQTNRCHTALVRCAVRAGDLAQDEGEDLHLVLVPYREIPERIARGEISHALVVVAFAWALGLQPPPG